METIDGIVSRTNGSGFKLEGHDRWLNLSKFGKPAPTMPSVGEHVHLSLNAKGYVTNIKSLSLAQVNRAQSSELQNAEGSLSVPPREAVITRLSVINSAISVLKTDSRPIDLRQVLDTAAKLEAWASRPL
jgi:hypothetical protein